jgi:hypothetical protein
MLIDLGSTPSLGLAYFLMPLNIIHILYRYIYTGYGFVQLDCIPVAFTNILVLALSLFVSPQMLCVRMDQGAVHEPSLFLLALMILRTSGIDEPPSHQ